MLRDYRGLAAAVLAIASVGLAAATAQRGTETHHGVPLITAPGNTTWAGNLMSTSGPVAVGVQPDLLRPLLVDPRLERRGGRLMLRSGSQAIDRAQGDYAAVVTDLEGQARRAPRDIGADEHSDAPIRCPLLTPGEVGPNAEDRTDCPLAIQEERRR